MTEPKIKPGHQWREFEDRWVECRRCRVRKHWKVEARSPCVRRMTDTDAIELWEACVRLHADLDEFYEWWEGEVELPSLDEWAAQYFEWRQRRKR